MNLSKYSILFNKIPKLKEIITDRKLNSQDLECLENIYEYYKNPIKNQKIELRTFLKQLRDKISLSELKSKSQILNNNVINLNEFQLANNVFCYVSFDKEIDTFYILNYCIENKKCLFVPVIKGNIMIPCKVRNLKSLIKNKYGILEPLEIEKTNPKNIDFTIVPGLGFNSLGYRIGYGKGYYDKFLKDFNGFSIGMVLKDFLTTKIIPQEFDQPVSKLIIL